MLSLNISKCLQIPFLMPLYICETILSIQVNVAYVQIMNESIIMCLLFQVVKILVKVSLISKVRVIFVNQITQAFVTTIPILRFHNLPCGPYFNFKYNPDFMY